MKKWGSNSITIKRTSTSPYFSQDFNQKEKETLESIKFDRPIQMLAASDHEALIDILITNTHTNFNNLTANELAAKLIIHPNSGYDNFNNPIALNLKSPIIIGNKIRCHAVANYILSAIFNHYCQNPYGQSWDNERKWRRQNLNELNITIIGLGHIGSLVKAALTPLAKNLFLYDPFLGFNDLKFLDSDIVILACGLNASSFQMINQKTLQNMKENVLIINPARGELIESKSLVHFLENHSLAFAILDVFPKEPNDFNDYKHLTNIKLSSHIAGVFTNIDQETIHFEKNIITDFLSLDKETFEKKYQNDLLQNRIKDIGLI